MSRIAIVEDDEVIREELEIFLQKYGYDTEAIVDFESVLGSLIKSRPDLILLDINLPFYDGYHICRELRKSMDTPIIVVTSRDSDVDELMSMNLGADDFVTKPYNTQILLARIESILKRCSKSLKVAETVEYGDIRLNLSTAMLSHGQASIELTKNEVKILSYLLKNAGRIVSRDDLMEHLWNSDYFADDSTLTVNMTRIRKKLKEVGLDGAIQTKRGMGYLMI